MKSSITKNRCGILAALMLASTVGSVGLLAQDSIIALGRANSAGALLNGTTSVNGVISSTSNGTGDYTVTVTAAGAFAGSDVNDYVVKVAVNSSGSGDESIKASVTSVTDNVVSFNVHIDDIEDLTDVDLAQPDDLPFHFTLYRVPGAFPANAGTRFLLGTGKVNGSGDLLSGAGVGGITISSVRNGTGDYSVTLSKPGGFVGDVNNDYVLSLSVSGTGTQDQVVRGAPFNLTSDDSVVFNIHTDDVQANPDSSLPTPADEDFYFTVYRIAPVEGLPASRLLVALARVNAAGTLLSAPNAFDGGTLSAAQNATGNYTVTIVSPGAFAGRTQSDFIAHVTLVQNFSSDEAIMSTVTIPDDDTLLVGVRINDLEQSGQIQGVPTDASFGLSLFDARAELQPDLRIGEKGSLTKMKGDNNYNATGAGQQLRLDLVSTSRKKYFFALENDGNIADNIRVKEKGAGSRVRTNYFRLTGGRANVTAKVKKAGSVAEEVNPGAFVRYEGRIKYLSADNRPGRKIRLTGTSLIAPSARDTVRLKVSGI